MAEKRTGLAPLPTGLLLRPSTQPKVEAEKPEPVKAEASRVEPVKAEASRVEPVKAEASRVEASNASNAKVAHAQHEVEAKSTRREAQAVAVAVEHEHEYEREFAESFDHGDRRTIDRGFIDDSAERSGGYRTERREAAVDSKGHESKGDEARASAASSSSAASSASVASSAQSAGSFNSATSAQSASSGSVQTTRTRRKKTVYTETKGRKLYLPDEIHDRLRLLAFSRREKVSTVAAEILDRNLPRLRIEREA